MAAAAAATSGITLTSNFEKLFLSTVRLSSAATLYGVHQFETAVSGWQQPGGIGQQLDRFGGTVNSLTQCLVREISPGKKDALDSIAEITKKMVSQSVEGLALLDPIQMFRAAGDLAQKSSNAVAGWTSRKEPAAAGEPILASDVLSR